MLQDSENIHPYPQKQHPRLMFPHLTWGHDELLELLHFMG